TLNDSVTLFSAPNPLDGSVGTLSYVGSNITGPGGIDFGGGEPRSTVEIHGIFSDYAGGATLTGGTLTLLVYPSGATGPLGTGTFTVAAAPGIQPPTLQFSSFGTN